MVLSGEFPAPGTLGEQRGSDAYADCVGWGIGGVGNLTLGWASSGRV